MGILWLYHRYGKRIELLRSSILKSLIVTVEIAALG